jgi:signal transduction histidine kinase/ActR/RegA family two-component response regulator/HAMP domain-containing protein
MAAPRHLLSGQPAMQRLPIARSLRLALVGLTVVLTLVAAIGVARLYQARQRYENLLVQSSALASADADTLSAGIDAASVLAEAPGPTGASARRAATSAFTTAAATATALSLADGPSATLLARQLAAERRGVALGNRGGRALATAVTGPLAEGRRLETAIERRAVARQSVARAAARHESRQALIVVIVAGLLALAAAIALIGALVASMRRPLDELVSATGELAAGDLERRVTIAGPRELQDLGRAFNAMGAEMATAQHRIEDERRRLAVTVESLGDALLVTEGDPGRVSAANPRAAELVPELPIGALVGGATSPLPALATALDGEVEIEHHGRSLAVTASPLGGEDPGVVWTVRDMSERARLERAKSDFVAMASHELRSPLTSIKGFVELLDRSSENMTERQRDFVDIILRSTDRLVELVGDLLDVARIEADRVEIDRRPIDIGEAVHDVVELMAPRFESKHQRLGVYIAPTLPLASADAGRVRQIVANLLTNAHMYTPEDGRIHIGVEGERAWVQIVVADSGIGLTEEERERVFERFYRAGAARSGTGTGLGLSIVKSLVEMHEGEIDVESEPGRGTTFRVRLPATAPEPGSTRALELIRGRRVLVVDDEREVAELIAGQLAPLDVQVRIATGSQEALALLHRDHFDAMTLDVLMPGMDGLELLSEVRRDPDLRRLPVVFVSVQAERPELAGEWTVAKPIDADQLRDALGAAVSSGRSRVLVVARETLQPHLEPPLDDLGIEHEWQSSGPAAARVCAERRFEVALIDVGIRNPQAVLEALDLRGRRLRRAVILFSADDEPVPTGVGRLGIPVVPVGQAAGAVLSALRGEGVA